MSDSSVEKAREILISFMTEMNLWECKYYPLISSDAPKHREAARDELKTIYDKYLTAKDRLTGRLAGPDVGNPPEYDPNSESIESTKNEKNKMVFYTQSMTEFRKKYRYTIRFAKNEWKIDKKEGYSKSNDKWSNRVF